MAGSGTEIFKVFRGDCRIGIDANCTSSVLGDLLLDSVIGIDDDEATLARNSEAKLHLIFVNVDFQMVVDRVGIDEITHVRVPLGSP